ncbi:hypothetical protein KIW84_021585 [Lathyrus oleraceus]|uniref:Uncharacterized protein n=1 Tax=Pisum sativum TaxID=3888 RepID=A0A9D4YDZ4_PEA|nr:hypothetical protein KIW84_021585 [Pisum sativum]
MYYNDKDSRHYQVAKALHSLAKSVFEDTSVLSLEQFHLESLPKNTQGGIPQDGKRKIIGHASYSELQMILGQACLMGPFSMLQHPISSSGPIPSGNIVMRGNLKESKGEGEKKEKDGEGTSINDGEIKELDLDIKL